MEAFVFCLALRLAGGRMAWLMKGAGFVLLLRHKPAAKGSGFGETQNRCPCLEPVDHILPMPALKLS